MQKTQMITPEGGKWVTESVFANISGLARQSLTNWRARDRKVGRQQAALGYPQYVYFGGAVRYWLPDHLMLPPEDAGKNPLALAAAAMAQAVCPLLVDAAAEERTAVS
jgi:hypothetical protein